MVIFKLFYIIYCYVGFMMKIYVSEMKVEVVKF